MPQYIDKSALVAEINRRIADNKKEIERASHKNLEDYFEGYEDALVLLKEQFLNTLEMKEVDLEEKATQLSQKYFPDEENIWARSNIEAHKCKSACIEMVEWLKAQKGE